MIITKGSLEDHLEKLSMVLTRLQDAGLKINANKSNFCTLEAKYLRYILTRDGIKPQQNKVQAMLALAPPTNWGIYSQEMVSNYCQTRYR